MDQATTIEQAKSKFAADLARAQVLGHIESDRFCFGCGYSLRGQPVRRHEATDILLVSCPECGRFEPAQQIAFASHPIMQRMLRNFMFGWYMTVFLLIAGEALGQLVGLTVGVYETVRWFTTAKEFVLNMLVFGTIEAVAGLAMVTCATVICPHWPRMGYVAFAVIRPLLPAALAFWLLRYHLPEQAWMCLPWFTLMALLNIIPGCLAAYLGRPIARIVTLTLIPPHVRGLMAYLWTTDGLKPPALPKPLPIVA